MQDVDPVKEAEKAFHERFYSGDEPLPLVSVADIEANSLQPCYVGMGGHRSDNRWAFHRLIHERGGWKGTHLLDYACGDGGMSIYFALTGARHVDGFDIAETAVRRGTERVARQGLSDRVTLRTMDASDLKYPDESFDMVIGTGVLHHVIKYPNIFEGLHKVMKPGARAFFMEGLADNPMFKLWWKIRGPLPQGDVPIFAKEVRHKARMFAEVEIHGDTLLHAGKLFIWRRDPSPWRRRILRATHKADQWLLQAVPRLRDWGSFSYIVLTK